MLNIGHKIYLKEIHFKLYLTPTKRTQRAVLADSVRTMGILLIGFAYEDREKTIVLTIVFYVKKTLNL